MLKVRYKFTDSEMKCCFQEGQKTKFRFQTAWKMWHLHDIHLPNYHHPSAKVIVTQRDKSFNLLIFLDPEHRNASDSEHNTFTTKKSRYLNRREKARSNCQKFQRIRGSGESEIVQRWKSFKHLNKHSIRRWSRSYSKAEYIDGQGHDPANYTSPILDFIHFDGLVSVVTPGEQPRQRWSAASEVALVVIFAARRLCRFMTTPSREDESSTFFSP